MFGEKARDERDGREEGKIERRETEKRKRR